LLVDRAQVEADLARAGELMAEGRTTSARELLEGRRDSRHAGARARAGLAVLAALEGGLVSDAVAPSDLDAFRPRLLMEAALRRGAFAGCLRLARLARGRRDDAVAAAYEAAARLETGDAAGAAALVSAMPALVSAPGPGRRLARVLEARAAGAVLTVSDRRGELAGFFDAQGSFQPEGSGPAAWVPPLALRAAEDVHPRAGVRLAADFDLSAAALAALGPYRGSIVLVDVATGDVLAAVSDARTRAEGGTPAFDQRRQPASIQKLVTTAAALRAGHDPDAEIMRMTCNGAQHYAGGTLWCSFPAGPLTGGLKEAFALSCNIAFANLAVELGWPAMVDELRRWGFDRPSGEMPGAGRVLQTDGSERDLAGLGIGLQLTDITPAHAALLGAVLAEGRMPEPSLVSAEDGTLGLSPRAIARRPARQILDPAWVPVLRRALAGVVEEGGTAEGVAPESFPVVMKTGTAAAPGLGYHVNYVGAGPLPHPTIAFCVRVTHEPSSHRVREAAQQVLSTLLEGLGRRRR